MKRFPVAMLLAVAASCLFAGSVFADEEQESAESAAGTAQFIRIVTAVADTVLERHVDPPTRQEMVLHGVRAMLARSGHEVPVGLGQRISSLEGDEQWRALLTEMWQLARSDGEVGAAELREQMLAGMLAVVPGGPSLIPPNEYTVEEQLRANRYVGIGIQLSFRDGIPVIEHPFRRGPARQAGALAGDRILSVDGVATEGKTLVEVVKMLRGSEGSDVTIVVQQPDADEQRSLAMTRGVVPLDTILGISRRQDGTWNYRTAANEPIAYLNLSAMRASALHELRRLEQNLREQQCRALILDLRNSSGGDLQQAIFLADAFLARGRIGAVRDAKGTRTYEADADCLFRDWPMAVLVGRRTSGEAEWLAAALQDNGRAMLVGEPTLGRGYAAKPVELPDGLGALQGIRVAMLRRADGRSLARPALASPMNRGSERVLVPGHQPASASQSPWIVRPDHLVRQPPTRINLGAIGPLTESTPQARPVDAPLKKARDLLAAALAEQANQGQSEPLPSTADQENE